MREYSIHKRFVFDVERAVIMEDVIPDFSAVFISLRESPSLSSINDDSIVLLTKEILGMNSDEPVDVSWIYPKLLESLTNQQLIFRIKRVKYLKVGKNSVDFVPHLLVNLGKQMFKNNLIIDDRRLRKMPDKDKKSELSEAEKAEKEKTAQKVKDWILENVTWKSRTGKENKGNMTAAEAESKIEADLGIKMSALRIRAVLREAYKD